MGCSTDREDPLSETRKCRKFSAQQKTEIVLRKWRDQFLAAGAERLQAVAVIAIARFRWFALRS